MQQHDIENTIFMHYLAPPHIYNPLKVYLSEIYGNYVIDRQCSTPRHTRSPDPIDLWLLGCLKDRV